MCVVSMISDQPDCEKGDLVEWEKQMEEFLRKKGLI